MNREEFFRKLGDIDPEYIEEADSPAKRPALWKKWAAEVISFRQVPKLREKPVMR